MGGISRSGISRNSADMGSRGAAGSFRNSPGGWNTGFSGGFSGGPQGHYRRKRSHAARSSALSRTFYLIFRFSRGRDRAASPARMQWPSRFPSALPSSSHDHALHSSGRHSDNGFSWGFTRTMRQALPRASIAVVAIASASIECWEPCRVVYASRRCRSVHGRDPAVKERSAVPIIPSRAVKATPSAPQGFLREL